MKSLGNMMFPGPKKMGDSADNSLFLTEKRTENMDYPYEIENKKKPPLPGGFL
jgi:hypothetical protein